MSHGHNFGEPMDSEAVMTFEDIAECLGVTKAAARQSFVRGITKLKRNPELLESLCQLAAERQRIIAKPSLPDWEG